MAAVLNMGRAGRVGAFLNSWTQTQYRVGDVNITAPDGSGSPFLFPTLPLWERVTVSTGFMPRRTWRARPGRVARADAARRDVDARGGCLVCRIRARRGAVLPGRPRPPIQHVERLAATSDFWAADPSYPAGSAW